MAKVKKYNVRERAEFFNEVIFNGELDLSFDIDSGTFESGFTIGSVAIVSGSIKHLKINTNNKLPHEALDAVVIHELIHVKDCQIHGADIDLSNGGHNDFFYSERDRIMGEFPEYPIPVRENLTALDEILDKLGY